MICVLGGPASSVMGHRTRYVMGYSMTNITVTISHKSSFMGLSMTRGNMVKVHVGNFIHEASYGIVVVMFICGQTAETVVRTNNSSLMSEQRIPLVKYSQCKECKKVKHGRRTRLML